MKLWAVVVATFATGLWFIVAHWPNYLNVFQMLSEIGHVAGPWLAVLSGTMIIVPVLKVAVAVGMWRYHRWAWFAAIAVLSVDILTLATSAVRFHRAAANALMGSELDFTGATIVKVYSMWPTYIVAVLGLVCLLVLAQLSARNQLGARSPIA